MAANFPGPWEVRYAYDVTLAGLTTRHQQRLSFDVDTVEGAIGDDFTEWIPLQKNGSAAVDLSVHVNNYSTFMADYYHTTMTIVNAELWKYAPTSFDATWYSVEALSDTGTGVNVNVQATEQIMVFRTDQGGIMKAHFMEGPQGAGIRQLLPLTNADLDLMADNFLAPTDIWRGRDNGYPIAFLGMLPGNNEALFKRYNR